MALTTAANVRALSGGQAIPAAEDTLLGVLITRAGVVIARHLGYPPASAGAAPTLESATYTRYSGEGLRVDRSQRRLLHVEPWPVTAITSIHEDTEEVYGASTLVSSDDYAITGECGQTVRLTPASAHGAWDLTPRAIKVVFSAGYASVPGDIEQAAIELVLHWWGLRQRRGMQSVTENGTTTMYLGGVAGSEGLPLRVLELLGPYRLPSTVL